MDDLLSFDVTERGWRLWDFRDLMSKSHLFNISLHEVRGHVQFAPIYGSVHSVRWGGGQGGAYAFILPLIKIDVF